MRVHYKPNVKAIIHYLKLLGVKVNNSTVNETLQNHPDWPGLLCISDSLRKWNIPNAVGKIDAANIDELPTPFIACTYITEAPLTIVTAVNAGTVEIYRGQQAKKSLQTKEDFLKTWTGIYLFSEPNENSGEENYKEYRKKAFVKRLIPAAAIAAVVLFSLLMLRSVNNNMYLFRAIVFQYTLLLTGVVVTTFLLWYEIDSNNPVLQKVCTGIIKGNCNAILTGKQSKLFNWLSWSEIGFFYFSGSLLLLLFIPGAITIIAWMNMLCLPYCFFSIYYQWQVAKQWCVLCLSVQAVFVLGAINSVANDMLFLQQLSFTNSASCLLLFLLPALTWFVIKPYMLQLQQSKYIRRSYLRMKFDNDVFETLLKKQKQIIISPEGLGIDIGNPAAANTIIKVCNPYCLPFAKAHPVIESLVTQNKNTRVKIIFAVANNENNPAIKPARHLLAIAAQSDEQQTKKALDDWYTAGKKDYEMFKIKYPLTTALEKQNDKIDAMEKWCKANDINFTPTVFVNGHMLPAAYSIGDIQYFLSE